jgi:hypothetical protein
MNIAMERGRSKHEYQRRLCALAIHTSYFFQIEAAGDSTQMNNAKGRLSLGLPCGMYGWTLAYDLLGPEKYCTKSPIKIILVRPLGKQNNAK